MRQAYSQEHASRLAVTAFGLFCFRISSPFKAQGWLPKLKHSCQRAIIIGSLEFRRDLLEGIAVLRSFPGMQVLMLSDPSKVSGGETQIRCGDGSVRNVNYPAAGYAIMLQVYTEAEVSSQTSLSLRAAKPIAVSRTEVAL